MSTPSLTTRARIVLEALCLLAIGPVEIARGDQPPGQAGSTQTVAKLIAALKDRSYWPDQYRAAQALGKLGPAAREAVPDLAAALKDPEPAVRTAVVRALGQIGPLTPEALTALRAATRDEDSYVRRTAAEVCEGLRERLAARATRDDVPVLLAMLKASDPFIRRDVAARSLGQAGSLSGSPEVLAGLKAAVKDRDPAVGSAAREACEGLVGRASREELNALVATLEDSDLFMRVAAARRLGTVGPISSEALAALKTTAAKGKDAEVRSAAAEAYQHVVVSNATGADVPALVRALTDAEPFVRVAAVRALGKVVSLSGPPEALAALKAAGKEDPTVGRAVTEAFEALASKATRSDLPVLASALWDRESFVRRAAARRLGQIGALTPEALDALRVAVKDEERSVRDAAAEACAGIRERLAARATRDDVPVLLAVLKDPDPFIRREVAARALARVASLSDSPGVLAALGAAVKDKDPDVRAAATEACETLINSGTRKDVVALILALKAPEPFVRVAAARTLRTVGVISPETLASLKAAARDNDPAVRRAAAEAYETLVVSKASRDDVPVLLTGLKDTDPVVRRAAARALAQVSALPAISETLAGLKVITQDKDQDVREAAVEAWVGLVSRSNRDDVPTLVAALEESEPALRKAAARALGKVGVASPEAWAALKAAAKDKDPEVRRAAAEAGESIPPAVLLRFPPVLELKRGGKKSFRLQVYRHNAEGAVVVKFEGLPKGVLIPEVSIPAGKDELEVEATTGNDAAPDAEQEVRLLAAAGGVRSESRALICLDHAPLATETYLRLGRLAEGEAALLERLKAAPKDDQARFGLGALQFIRGVERLGQSLHRYGARSENTNIPVLRLPVPQNSNPAPIDYLAFRRVLDDFHRDLYLAEATLAGVTDEKVKLPLRLALVRLDLDGDGKPDEPFLDILKKIVQRRQLDFLKSNPDFLICFDRGDVAWLRAYCHLLMGMLDFYLAFDTEVLFDLSADELFAKPEKPFRGKEAERQEKIQDAFKVVTVKEPSRLGRFRTHLIRVAELNRETWKHIRAETDDDHEWLPSPRQKGVLGLPVQEARIDEWLRMVAEFESLLQGTSTLSMAFNPKTDEKGLNLKTLLDDPPEKFVLDGGFPENLPDKYFSKGKAVPVLIVLGFFGQFADPTEMAYAAWFN